MNIVLVILYTSLSMLMYRLHLYRELATHGVVRDYLVIIDCIMKVAVKII